MTSKRCKKCGRTLPITEFYKHKLMKDGHLNECKDCHNERCRKYRVKMSKDPVFVERERERSKMKDKNRTGRGMVYSYIRNTKRDMKAKGFEMDGFEAHHWNYNLMRSVFMLSRRAHHCVHAMTTVNHIDGYTYTKDGKRIESEHDAFSEYVSILTKYEIYETPKLVNY